MNIPTQITSDTLMTIGGGGGLLWYLFHRLRNVTVKDKVEADAYMVMQKTVETLQAENNRLHTTVLELQQEVAKLHIVIADLTQKLTTLSIASENQTIVDQLAKEGKLDRRQRKE